MAEFTEPPLTTVRLLRTEVARLACDALLQSIRTHGAGVEFRMGTALVVRCSTAKAPRPRDPSVPETDTAYLASKF
jgi:DNA-binding LacI/PurR family transcriptional regulator